jgi:hypothetical protein
MAFLNLNIGFLAFADNQKSNQPDIRLSDIKWSLQGLPTNNFKQIPISLAPGETLTVASTERALQYSSINQFTIETKESGMKLKGDIGQALVKQSQNTHWKLTKANNGVCTLQAIGGDQATLGLVNSMDTVELGSGFSTYNRGQFAVLKATSNSIQFINDLGTTETDDIIGNVTVFSKKIHAGDIIDLTSPEFAFPNRGSFPISKVGADYIEIANFDAFPETVTNVFSGGIVVYPFAYKWMMIAVDRKITVGINGSSVNHLEVEPPVEDDIAKNPGLFIKRGKVFSVTVSNPGIKHVNGFLILAE